MQNPIRRHKIQGKNTSTKIQEKWYFVLYWIRPKIKTGLELSGEIELKRRWFSKTIFAKKVFPKLFRVYHYFFCFESLILYISNKTKLYKLFLQMQKNQYSQKRMVFNWDFYFFSQYKLFLQMKKNQYSQISVVFNSI